MSPRRVRRAGALSRSTGACLETEWIPRRLCSEVRSGAGTRYEAAVAACERVFAQGFVLAEWRMM